MPQKVEISHRTIIFTVLLFFSIWFIWAIKGLILEIFISVILMAAINPLVNRYENKKIKAFRISRTSAILIIYFSLLILLTGIIFVITQPLIDQTSKLIKLFPALIEQTHVWGIDQKFVQQTVSQLDTLPANIIKLIGSLFNNIFAIFTIFIISFYLLLERKSLHTHLTSLFGNVTLEKKIKTIIDDLEVNLGGWVRAESLLMLIVGLMTYVGLTLLGIPYSIPLAIIAGLMEILPNIGPTISAIPAIIVGLFVSPLVALGVLSLYIMVQLIENNFIVPQIMSKTLGLNPLITIISLLIGFNLGGTKGAILAVPTVLIIKSIIKYSSHNSNK